MSDLHQKTQSMFDNEPFVSATMSPARSKTKIIFKQSFSTKTHNLTAFAVKIPSRVIILCLMMKTYHIDA